MAQAPNNNVDQNGRPEASHQGSQSTRDMDQPGPTPRTDIEAVIGHQLEDYVGQLMRAETPINLPFIAGLMGPEDGSKHQRFLNWLHRNDNASDKAVHTHVVLNGVVFSDILTYAIQYPEPVNSLLDEIIEDCAQLCQQWHNLSIPAYHRGRGTVYLLMYGHYVKGLANPPRFIDVSLKQIVKRFCSDEEKRAWEQDSKLLAEKSTSAKNVPDYQFKIKVIGLWLEKFPDMTLAACALQVIQEEADQGQQEKARMGSEIDEMEM